MLNDDPVDLGGISLPLRAATRLGGALGPFDLGGPEAPGGWIILIEPELHLGPDILVPDLAGWRHSRMAELLDLAALWAR